MVELDIMVPLVDLGRSPNLEIQREVAALLSNISRSDVNKAPIANSPVIVHMIKLAQHKDTEVSRLVRGTYFNTELYVS